MLCVRWLLLKIFDENIKMEFVEGFLEKLKKDKKTMILIFLSVFMIFILFISELDKGDDFSEELSAAEEYNYFVNKEETKAFLENIVGAGNVEIMFTYESSTEYIYAKDTNENSKDKSDNDKEINYKSEHIIIKEDGNEKGLMIKEIYPDIRGIAVICDGGNDPIIKEQIVSSLSALFGISTNRISVVATSR